MKIAIDAGHGLGNRSPGVFDPGAVYAGVREADIAMTYAQALERELTVRGASSWMTRPDEHATAALNWRAMAARTVGCTHLVSIHCNAAESETAHGTETCYRIPNDGMARRVQAAVVSALGLRDRGIVARDELAVLRGGMPAVLVELGFLSNPEDRRRLLDPNAPTLVAHLLADALCSPS